MHDTTNRHASDAPTPGASDCAGCDLPDALTSRRRFLRDSFLSMAGALVAVGASRATALAMPLEFIEGTRAVDHGGQTISYVIPASDGAQIDKKNEVILVRWQGAVYAFNLSCPHQNTALKWDDGDQQFECPKHHSRFQPNGDYVAHSGRATRNMDRFAIVRAGNNITVDVDKLYQEDSDTPLWSAAVVRI